MAYSFTKIEKNKSQAIAAVFIFLIALYFTCSWFIVVVIKNYVDYKTQASTYQFSFIGWQDTLLLMGVAAFVAWGHWLYSTTNIIPKILKLLGAVKPDPKDSYHKQFMNIVEEVSVATGGQKMEPYIVPHMAMNAFALADFKGRAVIGVTEGLLARLSRAQLEAVVGHEAAHIVAGDCLETTITSSLFEMFSGVLKGVELVLQGSHHRSAYRYRSRQNSGGAFALLLIIYILLWITKFLSQLVRMFISREREYRADAVAVRLTRDPLSLAEALHSISTRWRGSGLEAEEMEAIFICSPKFSEVDEGTGFLSELFSTHPPMSKRLKVLMDLAHTDIHDVEKGVLKVVNKPRVSVPEPVKGNERWMVHKENNWQGPYDLFQMLTFGWLGPDVWVCQSGTKNVIRASDDKMLCEAFEKKHTNGGGRQRCVKCNMSLVDVNYEGIEIQQCLFCKGKLVHEKDVQKIILRKEVGFSENIKKIAEGLKKDERYGKIKKISRDPKTLYACPNCKHKNNHMNRVFYTDAYRIEIDRCFRCQSIWFDQYELEVLQCLIEKQTQNI